MTIKFPEFFEKLKESTAGRAITKQYRDEIVARRQKLIDEGNEAKKRSESEVAAIRAKIPAVAEAVAAAQKELRDAQGRLLRLEAEAIAANAAAERVARRNNAELLETAPPLLDEFAAEAQARSEALRREPPNILESGGWSQRVLGAANFVDSDYESRVELIRECLAVYHEAQTLKLTVASEEEARELVKQLRARIMREPELRRVVTRPEQAA